MLQRGKRVRRVTGRPLSGALIRRLPCSTPVLLLANPLYICSSTRETQSSRL